MTTPKPDHFTGAGKMVQPAQHEEIEWTDEDDKIMDQVWARLRAKGVKADPVRPVRELSPEHREYMRRRLRPITTVE